MMIYFNNVLIDNDAVAGLTNDYKIYVDNFYLGGVASNTFKLTCGKQFINNHPSEIIINDGTTSFHLQVDKITEDKSFYYYDLVDAMVNFDFQYDAKPLIDSNKNNEIDTHLSDILQDICLQANIECQYVLTTTDYVVNWWDNRITARDYISMIAEKEGCFARISDNGELDFIPVNSPSKMTIYEEYVSELFIGERKEITRVVYDNGVKKWEFGVDTGNTLYLNPNNVYILDASDVEQIYNKINGFVFYSITVSDAPIDSAIRAGDIITFEDVDGNLYPTIAQYSTSYGGGWMGGYSFDIKTDKQQETTVVGLFDSIKSISTTIDRTNASLEIVSQQTDENSSQLAELELTTDGLTATVNKVDKDVNGPSGLSNKTAQLAIDVNQLRGEIGDVTDITSTEEGYGELVFDNVNSSEPINMVIRATETEDIARLFPSSYLYPSPNLYGKNLKMYFHNTTENETFVYTLPSDLRYFNGVFDEFQWDYENQSCRIIRRIGVNNNLTKYKLTTEVIENYDMPLIFLSTGNYTINIPSFPNAYMKIRLMSQNMYTSQFATKVELKASITATSEEINLEVAKKVGNDEIISRINQSAEAITIDASKISLTGKTINLTSDNIAINSTNFSVTKDGLVTTNQLKANNADITGKITATSGSFSGTITSANATITGGSLKVGSRFNVDTSGNLTANNVNISGAITATSGTFTGTVSSSEINGGSIGISSGSNFFSMGRISSHPIVSGLNVNVGGGINFRTGASVNGAGSGVASINSTSSGGLNYGSGSGNHNFTGGNVNMTYGLTVGGLVKATTLQITQGTGGVTVGGYSGVTGWFTFGNKEVLIASGIIVRVQNV